jgi:hypothetical protein
VDLLPPAFVTAEFGLRSETPVGDHEEDRPFEKISGFFPDDLLDSEILPHLLENIERPVFPGVLEGPAGLEKIGDGRLLNTSDKLFESVIGALVGPAQGAEDMDFGPLFFRVPDVFGQLEIRDGGSIEVFAVDSSDIHDIYRISYQHIHVNTLLKVICIYACSRLHLCEYRYPLIYQYDSLFLIAKIVYSLSNLGVVAIGPGEYVVLEGEGHRPRALGEIFGRGGAGCNGDEG